MLKWTAISIIIALTVWVCIVVSSAAAGAGAGAADDHYEGSKTAAATPTPKKPNFIILFGDDIGHGDLGCVGHPTSRTPELDRMCREGTKLTMYLSGANVCSPSRASILTGRYYTRTGVWPGVFSPRSIGGLPLNETTIATALGRAGYATAMIGKWHLGVGEYLPTNHGFDYQFGTPMTQNECVSNIKFPGSAIYVPSTPSSQVVVDKTGLGLTATAAPPTAGIATAGKIVTTMNSRRIATKTSTTLATTATTTTCAAMHNISGVGLTSSGRSMGRVADAGECCTRCASDKDCVAWTYHSASRSCTVCGPDPGCVTPHTEGCQDATAGSILPIPSPPYPPQPPPRPSPPPSPGHHSTDFGPCPIFNGSDGAVKEQLDLLGSPAQLYDMLGVDERYDAAAEAFIRGAVSKSQPFFLYFCSHHTHVPQFAPDSFRGYSLRGLQGDSLGLIDRSAGRLMNLTRELGIDDHTLMVFSADNGGSLVWEDLGGVNGDLRCGKGTTYEGGHRVPTIVRWPGTIPAGRVVAELTSSLDWFPTMLGLAGVSLPTDRIIDGVDMLPVLTGTGPTKRTTFLYFEWRTAQLVAVRKGPWKLHIQTRGSHCAPPFPDPNCYDDEFRNASYYGSQPLLVNLNTDPGEAQLSTRVCDPGPDNVTGAIDPRCHSQEEVDAITNQLMDLYNKSKSDKALWAPSQIRRGSSADRFPCCSPTCSPKPYCCKCENGQQGPPAPTTVQWTWEQTGEYDPSSWVQV